jgi:hypothetical protein
MGGIIVTAARAMPGAFPVAVEVEEGGALFEANARYRCEMTCPAPDRRGAEVAELCETFGGCDLCPHSTDHLEEVGVTRSEILPGDATGLGLPVALDADAAERWVFDHAGAFLALAEEIVEACVYIGE